MVLLCLLVVLASPEPFRPDDFGSEISRYVFSNVVTLKEDETNNTIDFGFVPKKCVIGDFVWNDSNNNGIQDEGETGLPRINVSLYILHNGETEVLLNSTLSDINGSYSFEVPFGIYKVKAGEGQIDKIIKGYIIEPGMPEDERNFAWGPTELEVGNPKNDSNDHSGTMVVLDNYNQVNMTIDFGYGPYE